MPKANQKVIKCPHLDDGDFAEDYLFFEDWQLQLCDTCYTLLISLAVASFVQHIVTRAVSEALRQDVVLRSLSKIGA